MLQPELKQGQKKGGAEQEGSTQTGVRGSRARRDGVWGWRDRSCTRPGCSELSQPQEPFRRQRHGSFHRCRLSLQKQLRSFEQALKTCCSSADLPCPLVGESCVGTSFRRASSSSTSHHACGQHRQDPTMSCRGKAKQAASAWERSSLGWDTGSTSTPGNSGEQTHSTTGSGAGLLEATLTSPSRETCELLLKESRHCAQ